MPRHTIPSTPNPIPLELLEAAALWYKGGYTQKHCGYVKEYSPFHPKANSKGLVYQHRLVMERKLGRLLGSHEVVHHRNGRRGDNAPENLALMTRSEHQRMHALERQRLVAKRYDPITTERVRQAAADPAVRVADLPWSPMTTLAICKAHGWKWISRGNYHLTEAQVRKALQGRSTLEAAAFLGVSHQALRYKFDHLLVKRKSPTSRKPKAPDVSQGVSANHAP